jgi:L-2-hydroxyglutarate oxidase LhgO
MPALSSVAVLVIGAGVTGLAAGLALAERNLPVVILERHPRPGLDTSTRNSGVIHAGIYYPRGTLKAELCVSGRHLLYEFCEKHQVPHQRCGKLIVATSVDELPALEDLHARGTANGVERLELVDADFVAQHEPAVRGVAALYSPDTGILDQDALVRALLRACLDRGVIFLPATRFIRAERSSGGLLIETGRETIPAQQVVNAAGLYADDVSAALGAETFTIYPCRGEYVQLRRSRQSILRGLVYPLPHGHGLGVHLIRETTGGIKLGPTARYQQSKDDYENERLPVQAFLEPAQRLLREVSLDDLRPASSGIRARLHPPNETFADFLVRRDRVNPAVVQAAGIDSPGLTSCLAVGRLVARLVADAA